MTNMKMFIFSQQVLIMLMIGTVGSVVVQQVRFIATKTGRTDYAIAGDTVELSCHYMMKDDVEDVKQVVWSKDGRNIFRWRKNRSGLEVLSYTYKGHLEPSSSHSHITIKDVNIEMHGRYKCAVKTDLGWHEMELDMIVISKSNCKSSDWRLNSEPARCREMIQFDCRHMFPKPVPSCGFWNSKTDRFIRSVVMDISEELTSSSEQTSPQYTTTELLTTLQQTHHFTRRQPTTYRVRFADKLDLQLPDGRPNPALADLLPFAGHLVFRCDISVPETSWRIQVSHKLFDFRDGCNEDPLEAVEMMRHNYSQYASSKMRQAGYQLEGGSSSSSSGGAELEMLSSSLKYELWAPSQLGPADYQRWLLTNSSRLPAKLNCWQRPRYGSLARLSCAANPIAGAGGQPHPVRLIGANTLQCQPSGWVPLAPTSSRRPRDQESRQAEFPKPRPAGDTEEAQYGYNYLHVVDSRTSTTTNDINNNNNSPNLVAKPDVVIALSHLSNDLEHSSPPKLSSQQGQPTKQHQQTVPSSTSVGQTTDDRQIQAIPISSSSNMMVGEQSSHLVDRPKFENNPRMLPSQLATLLPSCVLVSQRKSNQQQTGSGVRIPNRPIQMREPSDGQVLGSTNYLQHHSEHHDHNRQHDTTMPGGIYSIFNFYSSSSGSAVQNLNKITVTIYILVGAIMMHAMNHLISTHDRPTRVNEVFR